MRGAREHNLRNISLDLPRDALIVFTGLSGSGKSSLAFDTIFAEGQRRYVESLSAYARQFLGQMDKPDVDFIEGLSPAVSIDQKSTSRNPRSTVGTITEVYDYLRLLYARAGRPHCPICGEPISRQSPQQIVDRLMGLPEGTRFQVLAPVIRGRKGEYARGVPSAGRRRVQPGPGGRRGGAADRPADPGQEVQAHHRGDRRPAGRQADGEAAADRLGGDRARPGPGRGHRRLRGPRPQGPGAGAQLLGEDGLPEQPRHRHRRARAAAVLVQRAMGRLPGVPRTGHPDGGRPRAGGAGRREEPRPGSDRAVGLGSRRRLLQPADRVTGRQRRLQHDHALAPAAGDGAAGAAQRRARPGARALPEPVRPRAQLQRQVRGGHLLHRAAARRGGERHLAGAVRRVHARGAVPGLQGRPAEADVAGGHGRRPEHRRDRRDVDRRGGGLPAPAAS